MKMKTMNWIVGIELIAFVVIYLLRLVTGGWNGSIMPGYLSVFMPLKRDQSGRVCYVVT